MLCKVRLATYAINMQVNLVTSMMLIHSPFYMSSLRISKCLVCKPESVESVFVCNKCLPQELIQSQGNNMMKQEKYLFSLSNSLNEIKF